jgi:hypothetical protein
LVGDAVNVTEAPAQIAVAGVEITTDAVTLAFTIIVIELLVVIVGGEQVALLVNTTLITSPLLKVLVV